MRFLIYNIAYGTGSPGGEYRRLWQSHRYLATPERIFLRILNFIDAHEPDVVGLVEADSGSRRTGGVNQMELVAARLGTTHAGANKYGADSWLAGMPYFRHQCNALIGDGMTLTPGAEWQFSRGAKKQILCAYYGGVRFVLVHLALKKNVRAAQIAELGELVAGDEPTVLAGDFNTFGGPGELAALMRCRGWRSVNERHLPTYPAWRPRRELDYILYSPGVRLTGFRRPDIQFSDHLPLLADFELE